MKDNNQLSASLEDYLETIYLIVQKKQAARAKDIADELQVRASSVTGALRMLSEKGLVNYAPYDIITLTREGEKIAQNVLQRHSTLYDFFKDVLGVADQEAEDSACKLEHSISPAILKRLKCFASFIQKCPRVGPDWLNEFDSFCKRGSIKDSCETCLKDCLKKLKK